jgi:WD40 repeat protein/serine/threonine protein kinase
MTGSISATCPGCGARASVPRRLLGCVVRCSRCQTRFPVAEDVVGPDARAEATARQVSRRNEAPASWGEGVAGASASSTLSEASRLSLARTSVSAAGLGAGQSVEWRVGDIILNRYEVTGILGEGGMGRVYKVRHRGWSADLAVKAPLPAILDAVGGASNFEREAETWVGLGLHPHVVACYYVRRIDGVPRVFAEFVDGGSLQDWIRTRRLTRVEAILDVAIQFAWGLHYAHEQGLVHRDVKPGNVLLTSDGVAKVTDFGLARARPASAGGVGPVAAPGQTQLAPGGFAGTVAYVSPEQAEGRPVTRRADLWSWALSVLEAFVGGRRWELGAVAAEVLESYLASGPSDEGLPPMPAAVADLLRSCFREDPEERPATLWDAAAALYVAYEEAAREPYPRREPTSSPQTSDSLNNRAVSLVDLGRAGEAEETWSRALAAEPHHPEATYNRALLAWTRGEIHDADALGRAAEARKTNASSSRAAHLEGRLLLALGETERAAAALSAAARGGDPPWDLVRDHALARCASGRHANDPSLWAEVSGSLRRLLDDGQVDPAIVAALALALTKLGREQEATALLAEAAEIRRDLPRSVGEAAARLLPGFEVVRPLRGLTSAPSALALTPDGRLALAAVAGSVRVWDAATGAAVRTLQAEGVTVRALAVSPDGRNVLWAGEGGAPQLAVVATGAPARSFQRQAGVANAVAMTGDSRLALAGGSDRAIRVWDAATGRIERVIEGHAGAVLALAVSADGTTLLSGSQDQTVRHWEIATGRCLGTFAAHKGPVNGVGFGPEGTAISAGEDGTIRQLDLATTRVVRTLLGHTGPVTALLATATGRFAISAGADRSVRAWDLGAGEVHAVARLEAPVQALALAARARTAIGACGPAVYVLALLERERSPLALAVSRPVSAVEAEDRDARFRSSVDEARRLVAEGDIAGGLARARDVRAIPGYGRAQPAIALWRDVAAHVPRTTLLSAWEEAALLGHADPVTAVAVTPDGRQALSGDMDGTIRVWDLEAQRETAALTGHRGVVAALAVTPDGRHAVSGGWDHSARLWSLSECREIRTFEGHTDYVTGVAVSVDGESLITSSVDSSLRVFSLSSGLASSVLEGHASAVSSVATSPDGRFVVSGSWDQTVRAWDSRSGECAVTLSSEAGSVMAVAIAPSGRQLAAASQDGTIRLWDVAGRRVLLTLAGHTGEVTTVAFSPDGRRLASGGRDRTARIWDVASGRCERSLDLPAAVISLCFFPDGFGLVAGGADGAVRLLRLDWDLESRALPDWDERVRPFLECFLSSRNPGQSGAAPTWTAAQLEALLGELRHRGFGWLKPGAVERRLRAIAAQWSSRPAFWDTVVASAPQTPKAPTRRETRRIPYGRLAFFAAAAVLFLIGISAWIPRSEKPSFNAAAVEAQRLGLHVLDLSGAADCGAADVSTLAAWAFEKEGTWDVEPGSAALNEAVQRALGVARSGAGEPGSSDPRAGSAASSATTTLAPGSARGVTETNLRGLTCLAKLKLPGSTSAILERMVEAVAEPTPSRWARRNALSALVAIGDAAVPDLCDAARTPTAETQAIALQALAVIGTGSSRACFLDVIKLGPPESRRAAAKQLPSYLMQGVSIQEAIALVESLAADEDAQAKSLVLSALTLFDAGTARRVASRFLKDPDPGVVSAAQAVLREVEGLRRIEQLRKAGQ